jgi:hypothetical protein
MTEDLIFTPLKFRNLTVKNRIFRSNISGRFDNEDARSLRPVSTGNASSPPAASAIISS